MLTIDEIHAGDNVELTKRLPANCIDLTVASPPYDLLRKYKNAPIWKWEDFIALAPQLYRVTKPGGVVVWIVGDQTIDGSETGTSFKQALYFKDVIGFNLHDTMIYEKAGFSSGGPLNTYWQAHEYMFILSKGKPAAVNIIRDRYNSTWGEAGGGRKNQNGLIITRDATKKIPKYGRRTNVWQIPAGHDKNNGAPDHPAPFPEALARDHILSWSNPGDLIFDPFMGSGTTAKAAMQNGRHYLGIEINPDYVTLARRRLDQANPPLFKAPAQETEKETQPPLIELKGSP